MPAEIRPEPLARLVDAAERPRAAGWSLRAALTRYAQPQPQRASNVIEGLRRIEFALKPHLKTIEREGEQVWGALEGGDARGVDRSLVALLAALALVDGLGDQLAAWAVDRGGERPDDAVDAVTAEVDARLKELGVPHEERPRPPAGRRG